MRVPHRRNPAEVTILDCRQDIREGSNFHLLSEADDIEEEEPF